MKAALLDLETNVPHPLGETAAFTVGRSREADLVLMDVACSRVQFRLHRGPAGYELEAVSANCPTYLDGAAVAGRVVLAPSSVIHAGNRRFRYIAEGTGAAPPPPASGPAAEAAPIPTAFPPPIPPAPEPPPAAAEEPPPRPDLRSRTMTDRFDSDEWGPLLREAVPPIEIRPGATIILGRDAERATVRLDNPRVSRIHARLSRTHDGRRTELTDLGSANGTFVNGVRIHGAVTLKRGDRLDVGPYALAFDGHRLAANSRVDNVELVARDLRMTVKHPETRAALTLIDGVSLVVRPREFVAILGPSGSGKSTLMNALSARSPADEGRVFLNRLDFYACFDSLKQDVAVVSQKDALHDALRVEDALRYTARLRLPPDTLDSEIEARVAEVTAAVGLEGERQKRIHHLSGGQVKRTSLANETLSRPGLIFLDEVTSGLDEQTDREMMALFRGLADAGKTVICITHSLTNVERHCHLVVFLAPGGRLAFVGGAAEALRYFDVERLGDVYERLADPSTSPDAWKRRFLDSPEYRKYVADRLVGKPQVDSAVVPSPRLSPTATERVRSFLHQFGTLSRRYLALQLADRRALGTVLAQCVIVACLVGLLFGKLDGIGPTDARAGSPAKVMFILALSSLWFGCNNAAKEIVKERTIYERESDVNLQVASYYASKAVLLGLISVAQASVLFGLVGLFCRLPGEPIHQWAFLAGLATTGVAMGLLISSASKTEETAVALVPIALIPQLILAGVLAPLEGAGLWLARASVTAYWGFQGLSGLLPDDLPRLDPDNAPRVLTSATMVGVHLAIYTLAALAVLVVLDRRAELRGMSIDAWVARAKSTAQGAWGKASRFRPVGDFRGLARRLVSRRP